MQTTISMDSVLEMLRPLSGDDKKWLADKLYEDIVSARKLKTTDISRLRGFAKGITSQQIEADDRLSYILSK